MSSAEETIMESDSYLGTLTTGFKWIWDSNQFSDVTLRAEDQEFKCHKVILVANSEYFTSVFTKGILSDFKEKVKNEIQLPVEIGAKPFETILKYFYTGRLALSIDNVAGVVRVADYFRLQTIRELCEKFMITALGKINCIQMFILAEIFDLDDLSAAAVDLILLDIETLPQIPNFLDFNEKHMKKLLNGDIKPELAEPLFTTIIKWVSHNKLSRISVLADLLDLLPIEGFSHNFCITNIKNERILRNDLRSMQWLIDTFPSSNVNHRLRSIFIISSCNEIHDSLYVKLTDPEPVRVQNRPEIHNFACATYKNDIYLVCGSNTDQSFKFEEMSHSWVVPKFTIEFDQFCSGATILDDSLYIIGGREKTDFYYSPEDDDDYEYPSSSSCTKFDFCTQKSFNIKSMNEARVMPGVAVHENCVYASCGYGSAFSIERYDPREGDWHYSGNHKGRIEKCSSAIVGHWLYTCDIDSGRMERIDLRTRKPQEMSSPLLGSGYCWITLAYGDLYAVVPDKIVKYDALADSWVDFSSHNYIVVPIIVPWTSKK